MRRAAKLSAQDADQAFADGVYPRWPVRAENLVHIMRLKIFEGGVTDLVTADLLCGMPEA